MRFKADGPAIPDILLNERDAGNVVFLCGAGVSKPAGMPDFLQLAQHVRDELDPPPNSEARRALQIYDETARPVAECHRPSLDRIFQMLYQEYGRESVVKIIWKAMRSPKTQCYHDIIARLSASANGNPQLVTTNFDRLFERALGDQAGPIYEPPTYPALRHGESATGITYLHGRLAAKESGPHGYVLSSAELGRAYVAEGWAAKFIRDLLQRHSVVLLGYRAEDPPVQYLLEGLESIGPQNRHRLFAFTRRDSENVEAKWKDRGVTAIPYDGPYHDALWETLEAWADRARNPTSWRRSVVEMSGKGPRPLKPHERGMVAHVVKTTVGAHEFAERDPRPPAEWLCVFDVDCRLADPGVGFGEYRAFDPLEAYRLDDDPSRPLGRGQPSCALADDLISWRSGDERAHRWQRLSYRYGTRHVTLPPRLFHLAKWLTSCVADPVLLWWVARQSALHPRLRWMLKRAVDASSCLTDGARRGWMILFDAVERRHSYLGDGALYDLLDRIQKHGWTAGLICEFEALAKPVCDAKPPKPIWGSKPPPDDWSHVKWKNVADFHVRFPPCTISWPLVPEADVPWVYAALERNLVRTSERFRRIGTEVCDHDRRDRNAYIDMFRALLERLWTTDAERVRHHIALWPNPDPYIFDQLRLRIWRNSSMFSGTEIVEHVLTLSRDQFWGEGTARSELLSLLNRRWDDLPAEDRRLIGRRILNGPPQLDEDDEAHGARRQKVAAIYFGWLVRARCDFPEEVVEQWKTLKGHLSRWDDRWLDDVIGMPAALGIGDVKTNEDITVLNGLSIGEIASCSLENSRRTPFIVSEPFTGLVKTQPGRAIRALGSAARRGEFSAFLWSSALRHWPENAPPRATRVLHVRMRQLPSATIVSMCGIVGKWLRDRFPDLSTDDRAFAFGVFDHLIEPLLAADSAAKSSQGKWLIGMNPIQASRPTYMRAINAPIGKAVQGLLEVLQRDNPEHGAGFPKDFKVQVDRLVSASGEGADDAVCVLSARAAWLRAIDPAWVDAKLVPCFVLDHDRAESAWNGILWSLASLRLLFDGIKDGFLGLPTRYDLGSGQELERYCRSIVDLAVPSNAIEPILPFKYARQCLRRITPEGREHVIRFLGSVDTESDDVWRTFVIPFIRHAWPNESQYRTSGTSNPALFMNVWRGIDVTK